MVSDFTSRECANFSMHCVYFSCAYNFRAVCKEILSEWKRSDVMMLVVRVIWNANIEMNRWNSPRLFYANFFIAIRFFLRPLIRNSSFVLIPRLKTRCPPEIHRYFRIPLRHRPFLVGSPKISLCIYVNKPRQFIWELKSSRNHLFISSFRAFNRRKHEIPKIWIEISIIEFIAS